MTTKHQHMPHGDSSMSAGHIEGGILFTERCECGAWRTVLLATDFEGKGFYSMGAWMGGRQL